MKLKAKILGLAAASMLTIPALAQQTQQTQPTQPGQTQQTQQTQPGQTQQTQPGQMQQPGMGQMGQQQMGQMGQMGHGQMGQMQNQLNELRQLHQRLGQIIQQLEGDMMGMQQFDQRFGAIDQRFREAGLREAQRELTGLRQAIEAGDDPEGTAMRIGQIRSDLRRTYAGATGEAQQFGQDIDREFQTLEQQVRAGEADAMTTFEGIGTRFGEELERGRQQFQQQDRQQAIQRARTDLAGLRTAITTGEDAERTGQELARIRGDLETGFFGAGAEERAQWEEFRGQFETFQERIGAGEAITEEEFDEFQRGFDRFQQPGMQGQPGTGTGMQQPGVTVPAATTPGDTDTDDEDDEDGEGEGTGG